MWNALTRDVGEFFSSTKNLIVSSAKSEKAGSSSANLLGDEATPEGILLSFVPPEKLFELQRTPATYTDPFTAEEATKLASWNCRPYVELAVPLLEHSPVVRGFFEELLGQVVRSESQERVDEFAAVASSRPPALPAAVSREQNPGADDSASSAPAALRSTPHPPVVTEDPKTDSHSAPQSQSPSAPDTPHCSSPGITSELFFKRYFFRLAMKRRSLARTIQPHEIHLSKETDSPMIDRHCGIDEWNSEATVDPKALQERIQQLEELVQKQRHLIAHLRNENVRLFALVQSPNNSLDSSTNPTPFSPPPSLAEGQSAISHDEWSFPDG